MKPHLSPDLDLEERLRAALRHFPAPQSYLVAFSGGLDSTVLLHALSRCRDQWAVPLQAIHIHHGLQPLAEQWLDHCAGQCQALAVPFVALRVAVARSSGEGLEAAARRARYHAISERMAPGDMLLTAHHQDDQAETLLLQLLRGAGVAGVAAMAPLKPFAGGWHGRPLLGISRAELHHYAQSKGLAWVDDPSNLDVALERNYLRQRVVPRLHDHYPALGATLARSARHFAEAQELLGALGELDFARCGTEGGGLSVALLGELSAARQRNLLRYWIARRGFRLPDSRRLQQICDQVLPAAVDAAPLVNWGGAELRRYRDTLTLMAPLPAVPQGGLPWRLERPLALPAGLGLLHGHEAPGEGLALARLAGRSLEVRFRRGGERCRPAGRHERHTLKNLWQERGIPPWQRERMPLLFVDGELAQVADLWCCEPFAAQPGEPGIVIEWTAAAIENGSENNDN